MTQELSDDVLSMAEMVFNDHIDGMTYERLAEKYNISRRKVANLLVEAREKIFTQLLAEGKRYFAEVWARYDFIYREAMSQWQNSQNPNFMREMRACLEAQRRMLGLDAAPKASVNEYGQAIEQKLVIIMSPDAYDKKEKELSGVIEGKATEIP